MKQLILAILLGIAAIGICFAHGGNKSENIVCMDSTDTEITTAEIEEILSSMIGSGIFETSPPKMMYSDKPFNYIPYEDPPEPINPIVPEYPESAKKLGIEGIVVLEVYVYADGTIGQIKVIKSLMAGPGGLNEAAINAVKQWKFQPGKSGGKPIDTSVIIPIEFTLPKQDKEFNDWINPDTKGREFDYQYNDIPPQPIVNNSVKKYFIPYPDSLTKRKIEDGVKFVIDVYKDGVIHKIVYVRPIKSGMGGLSKIALDTIKGWKFEPGTRNGKPIDTSADITVGFVLEQAMGGKSTDNGLPDDATAKISVVLKKDVKKVKKEVYKVWINEHTKDRVFNPSTDKCEYCDPPEPINPVPPEYPRELLRTGIQGVVVLEVNIFNDGEIRKITIKKSLSDGLDEAAINAVKKWKFKPGRADGKPVDTSVIIPVEFTLTN